MGQFKPMVKMMTTEPSVELKLAKGGAVKMKKGGSTTKAKKMADGGGALNAMMGTPALIGRPAVNAPVRAPGKPSMAARRKAMMAKPAMPAPMKKGGKAEGGESKAEHKAEMSKMKGLEKELKSHESKPASKGHKGLATGGVALGNAGGYKKGGNAKKYASGGIINTENQGGKYRDTLMHTAEYTGKTSGKTGGVKEGNGGGYKTGGVALSNAGGYKRGGKTSKKAYATGGKVDSGAPVAMPQGRKTPSSPVSISKLSGTFKKGGKVTPAEGRLMKNNAAENATAMRQAKAQSNEVYSKYQKKMADGGAAGDKYVVDDPKAVSDKASRELEEALNPLSMVKELYGKARDALRGQGALTVAERDSLQRMMQEGRRAGLNGVDASKFHKELMKSGRSQSDIDSLMRGLGAVTETERSVTVSPSKKRGGRC